MNRKLKIMANLLLTATFVAVFASCDQDDPKPVEATGVTLNKTTLALAVGDTETLKATVAPDDAADKTVTWSSSAPEVATVTGGAVTAVAKGTATVTVSTANGRTDNCEVTVNDGHIVETVTFHVSACNMQWAPGAAACIPAEGAEVKIYQGETLVQTCRTDAEGVAAAQLEAGDYTYTAARGDEKNISAEGYLIAGIFTSQGEINHSPAVKTGETPDGGTVYRTLHPGDLKYVDINGDGIIDSQDVVEKASLSVDRAAEVDVYIASGDPVPAYTFDYGQEKAMMKQSFKDMLALANQIDAAMTHEAVLPEFGNYMDFTFGPSDSKLGMLWDNPYIVVKSANNILTYTGDADNISEAEKAEYKAEARYYRAYAYSVLLNYFGGAISPGWAFGVPIIATAHPSGDEPRNSHSEVVEFILADCDEAIAFAPAALRCAASQIKVRVLFQKGELVLDFSRVYQASQQNLDMCQAAGYGLPANLEWGGSDAIGEGISYSAAAYPEIMRKGDPVYPVRYVETLLLYAEAANETGRSTEALQAINQIVMAKGQVPILSTGSSQAEIREAIINLCSNELNKEGLAFARLKRTGRFMPTLSQYGATEWHQLLPVPASVMNSNPNIQQSPGW
jgi:hypothetical protein